MSIKGSVTITLDGSNKSAKLPLLSGSLGPDSFDIRKLHGDLGVFTYDPGYGAVSDATAAPCCFAQEGRDARYFSSSDAILATSAANQSGANRLRFDEI